MFFRIQNKKNLQKQSGNSMVHQVIHLSAIPTKRVLTITVRGDIVYIYDNI